MFISRRYRRFFFIQIKYLVDYGNAADMRYAYFVADCRLCLSYACIYKYPNLRDLARSCNPSSAALPLIRQGKAIGESASSA